MAKSKESDIFDASFEDYGGKKRFCVSHPEHPDEIKVAAPDEVAALIAAADFWGKKWTRYGFYAYATVTIT